MTIKVLDKIFNVTKENASEVSKKLTDMFFETFDHDEEREITDAMADLYNSFGLKLNGGKKDGRYES